MWWRGATRVTMEGVNHKILSHGNPRGYSSTSILQERNRHVRKREEISVWGDNLNAKEEVNSWFLFDNWDEIKVKDQNQ